MTVVIKIGNHIKIVSSYLNFDRLFTEILMKTTITLDRFGNIARELALSSSKS